MLSETVIVSAARTPFGKFGGALRTVPAVDLGATAIREAVRRSGLSPEQVETVVMGMVLQAGAGQIPSRQASLRAGLPNGVYSDTINKVCISSLRAVSMADQIIRAGDAGVVVAGGMESMSNVPYALTGARWGQRMGDGTVLDLITHDGLTCALHNVHMAALGSRVAAEYGISREAQDAWACRSQQKAVAAIKSGRLDEEIVPVEVPQKKGVPLAVHTDECPREDTTPEKLAALPPVFVRDGSVTAGNAPGINDGAGALVVMSEQQAADQGIQPLATIVGHASVAAEPAYIATVPGLAANKLLDRLGMKIADVHLIESNEAFAAVTLTSAQITGWNPEIVNVNGGAIAFGHPIGASGARILMTLIFELRRRGGGYGLACICGGGAQGEALMVRV